MLGCVVRCDVSVSNEGRIDENVETVGLIGFLTSYMSPSLRLFVRDQVSFHTLDSILWLSLRGHKPD